MTQNQLAYNKLLEDVRSHRAQEELTSQRQAEEKRHNYEVERYNNSNLLELTRHNFETERISDQDSVRRYESAKYAADSSAAAQRYAADTSAAATRYAASVSASATRYAADTNYKTQTEVAKTNKAAKTFETNVRAQLELSKQRNDREIAKDRNATTLLVTDKTAQGSLIRTGISTVGSLLIGGVGAAAITKGKTPRKIGF